MRRIVETMVVVVRLVFMYRISSRQPARLVETAPHALTSADDEVREVTVDRWCCVPSMPSTIFTSTIAEGISRAMSARDEFSAKSSLGCLKHVPVIVSVTVAVGTETALNSVLVAV